MKRGRQVGVVSACGTAGLLSAVLLAASPVAGADDGTTTAPTTTAPATTAPATTAPTTGTVTNPPAATAPTTGAVKTAPKRTVPRQARRVPRLPRAPRLIAAGVTVGGVLVGGLTAPEAKDLVRQRFTKPLTLVVRPGVKVIATPRELGAASHLSKAIKLAARVRRPGFAVSLRVDVRRARIQRLLAGLGEQYGREPVDARLKLRDFRPVATRDVPGRRLREVVAARTIVRMLKTHDRAPVPLQFEEIRPALTASDLGEAIVIRRDTKQLLLYRVANEPKLIRRFPVATGRTEYPTPLGKFEIVTKQENPWWYPPTTSEWAQGKEPVPPGPGNPLGTRWMGISSPYVGIHGTPDPASIGYSASHGCIRMLIPEAEWLFTKVDVGTPVFIVSA